MNALDQPLLDSPPPPPTTTTETQSLESENEELSTTTATASEAAADKSFEVSIEEQIEDTFELIKRVRRETGLLSRAMETRAPRKNRSLEQLMTLFKSQVGEFTLTPAQIEFFYPQSRNNIDFSIVDEALQPNQQSEFAFLEDLLPPIIPDESYFEEGELAALNSDDYPLRFSIQHYIRKFLLALY